MKVRIFVVGMGAVTPAGAGVPALLEALLSGGRHIRPLSLFPANSKGALPVGELPADVWADVVQRVEDGGIPRTHALALAAALEAVAGGPPPDAVVLGGTTGGMGLTEVLLKEGVSDLERYRLHGTGTVAEYVAFRLGCTGPALTVSTACSSGAVAVKLGMELIRSGRAHRVLVGGADCLCRLTYYGFSMLQLIDPDGTRPLDRNRNGMSVAEGAGMLLLEGAPCGEPVPDTALAEVLGAGLSCDAYHPSAPHPEGAGALSAMKRALAEAGVAPGDVSYVNLHGTGTRDNDAAEAKALVSLFGPGLPPVSSTKGGVGHSLAAAGAVEAVISVLALRHGVVPGNVGLTEPDPAFGLVPAGASFPAELSAVLSNSFGFGGNNAAVLFGPTERNGEDWERRTAGADARAAGAGASGQPSFEMGRLRVLAVACISGAGHTTETLSALAEGRSAAGVLPEETVTRDLPPRALRRMKRLPRLTLALADAVLKAAAHPVDGIYLGTGWGPLSETWEFLDKLFGSNLEFSSPTDFVGSVHNAVAGQVAIWHKATGPNITATGGDTSFEQALLAAQLTLTNGDTVACVLGADEAHEKLSPLLDESVATGLAEGTVLSDGGAGLVVALGQGGPGIGLRLLAPVADGDSDVERLVNAAGGAERVREFFGAILAGIPAARRTQGKSLLDRFLARTQFEGAVVDYRLQTGELASASAIASAWAVREVSAPGSSLAKGRGILLLGLGETLSVVEVLP